MRRQVEQRWVVSLLGFRVHDVAEADIDLHRDAGLFQERDEGEPHALVVGVLLDAASNQCRGVEAQAVVYDDQVADFAKHRLHDCDVVLGVTKQVDVASRARRRGIPRIQQERAFEQETATMRRLRQTVQQPLKAVVLQHFLKRTMPGFRLSRQPRAHRRSGISRHATASR